ncbi:MAG: lysophospholipid acyltransferase family protein [Marmoricola sp.]
MTAELREDHLALPRTTDVRHPARMMLHGLRPGFATVARRRWDISLRNVERVPGTGATVMAGNHMGFIDGPLMAIVGPRPVHALTKDELFSGPLGAFLTLAGQIPVNREEPDPMALRLALRVLRDGGQVGMFPESTRGAGDMARAAGGAAYLAMVTGSPVVPVAFLGTRLPGSDATFPPAGTRIVISYGEPLAVEQRAWPRRSADIAAVTEQIRQAIITTTREAVLATGIELPGPLPGNDEDEQ